MARLEEIRKGAKVLGIAGDAPVTVIDVTWHGDAVLSVVYRTEAGRNDALPGGRGTHRARRQVRLDL